MTAPLAEQVAAALGEHGATVHYRNECYTCGAEVRTADSRGAERGGER